MVDHNSQEGCLGRRLILLVAIVALAIGMLAYMGYSLTELPSTKSVEPMGPNTAPTPPDSGGRS